MGVGDAIFNVKVLDDVVEELKLLSGQIPVITKEAKKAISNFQIT
ncbi:50S ribosomal protein L5 [Areca yellow leaf disease phytoplasma]